MNEGTTLKWRRHRLASPRANALRSLTRRPLTAPAPPRTAGPAPSDLELPDELSATPLEKAVTLLRVASQIEHALMVQYLDAAYSVGGRHQRQIAGVAIEDEPPHDRAESPQAHRSGTVFPPAGLRPTDE
jgi:Ferritin-like